MIRLKVTEEWRCEDRTEAESFIKTAREAGPKDGYDVLKAGYVHKTKKAKGEIIDECEVVTLVKEYNGIWTL